MAFTWTDIINGEIASSIRSKLNLLGTEAETLDTSVTQNTANISTNTSNISTLQGQMTTAQSNIATNTTNITTNTTSVGNLTNLDTTDKSNLVNAINEVTTSIIIKTVTILASQAVSDSTYTDYPYRVDIPILECTTKHIPDIYPQADIADVSFSRKVRATAGTVSVWASNNSFANVSVVIRLTKEV